ncbi:MAG: serine hydrolase domain-containing protein [Betaproteobacteria bacterium]
MTPTHSGAPARLNRRQLLALGLSSAALTACGGGGGNTALEDAANAARRKDLLEQTASKAVAAGLVSASLHYADRQSSAAAAAGLRQKGAPAATAIGDWLRIGSVSKAMTACMAAKLIDRGQLSCTLSLADALPDLAAGMLPAFRSVTVVQLLEHRGGLIAMNNEADIGLFLEFLATQTEPLPETLAGRRRFAAAWALQQAQPGVTPGQDFLYSNVGYMLVGMILEARSGKSFTALFDELIVPLVGMPGAPGLSPGLPTTAGLAIQRGHVGTPGAVQFFEWNPPELEAWNEVLGEAAGGVFATVTGYAKWQQLHQQALSGEPTPLPAAYVERLRKPVGDYVLGWDVGPLPDAFKQKVCLSHAGTGDGFNAFSVIALDGQFAISAFTNTDAQEGSQDPGWAIRPLIKAINDLQAGWA